MDSLHVVFAVRIRDLSSIALAWEFVRFKNGSFVDRWRDERLIRCKFENAKKVRHLAIEILLEQIDLSLYDEIIIFSEFPYTDDIMDISQNGNISWQRTSAFQSETLARLIDRSLRLVITDT